MEGGKACFILGQVFVLLLFESSGFLCSSSFCRSFEHWPSRELDCLFYIIYYQTHSVIATHSFITGHRLRFGLL